MNKLMAILFLLGALAGFGLSVASTYQVQDQTPWGNPVGEPRTVRVSHADRFFYLGFAGVCMAAALYFLARVRREDSR